MKLLLIQPPIEDFYDTDIRLQPIGLAYLKAAISAFLPKVNVKIVDFHHGHGRFQRPIPRELRYLKDFYPYPDKNPFCSFHGYYHFGASYEVIAEFIATEKPDVVGISSLFSPYYREVIEVAKVVKKVSGAHVIVGGSHASAHPQSLRECQAIDEVIEGEGERAIVERLAAIFKLPAPKIPEDFYDALIPDLSDFSPQTYQYKGKPLCFMITSRSCPHKCSFCSVHMTFGHQYRRRSVESVIKEMSVRYQAGYRVFDFEDDNLTFYQNEMRQLCLRIIDEFPKKDIELLAMNGISYLSLDRSLLSIMREAGFTRLNLSLVSSDKSVRESTKRPHTLKKYFEIVESAFELGLSVTSYQIIGLPNESVESMIQTLAVAARLPVLLGASMFYLTPNSPLAKQLNFQHQEEDIFKSRLTAMAFETQHVTREDIYTLFVTTRVINFLKGLDQNAPGPRDDAGFAVLVQLQREGILYASTPQGFKPLPKFNFQLYQRIMKEVGFIVNLKGEAVDPKILFGSEQPEERAWEAV